MANVWQQILGAFQTVGGGLSRLLGGWDGCLRILLVMIALDYISALILGWMGKSVKSESGGIDSKVGLRGLFRKALILMILAVAAQVDMSLGNGQHMMRNGVTWFYIANEGISVLENAGLAGVPLPKKLKAALGQLQNEEKVTTVSKTTSKSFSNMNVKKKAG